MKEQNKNITKLYIYISGSSFVAVILRTHVKDGKESVEKWLLPGALEKLLSAAYLRQSVNDADRTAKKRMSTATCLWF